MPWVGPPSDVRRRVEEQLGDGIWQRLSESWDRAVMIDPGLKLTQWYRDPQQILHEYRTNPRAALYTQHGLGLAVDVTPSRPELKGKLAERLRAAGFHIQTYPSSRHIHAAVLSNVEWARSPLQKFLRERLRPILRASAGR